MYRGLWKIEQIIKSSRVANVAQLNANTYLTLNDGSNKEKRLTYNNYFLKRERLLLLQYKE